MVGKRPVRPVVLITGASSGLGLALARHLLRLDRHRLVLTARLASLGRFSEQGLVRAKDVLILPLDVTNHLERVAAIEAVTERWGGVDVLVNNAGTMTRAVMEHASESDHRAQFEVNFHAPMELSREVLPGMRARRYGRIINISSVSGMMAMPTMGLYSASKFALEGASEALSYEVRPWNVFVTLIQPGFINSDGFEQVRYTDRSQLALETDGSPYQTHYQNMASFIARLMRTTRATPENVASRVARVIDAKKPSLRVAGTYDAFLFSALRRILPRDFYHEILYRSLPGISQWGPAPSTLPLPRRPSAEGVDRGIVPR
jgi:NAD(P)-dependent dehydrogenase (short-subunit alcohol dehydrogenase family)